MPRVISVGRLDAESEGLLLLTTQGALARAMELPTSGLEREYNVLVATGKRDVTPAMVDELAAGLTLSDGTQLRPMAVEASAGEAAIGTPSGGKRWLRMVLKEGKNREIRRVWEHWGFSTLSLVRTAYGPFDLGTLTPGGLQKVGRTEVAALQKKARGWSDAQGRRRG